MTKAIAASTEIIVVALVDGDASVRHARQTMLRSMDFRVRSYGTTAALLADRRCWDFVCIILDVDSRSPARQRQLRTYAWCGTCDLASQIKEAA